MIYKFWIGVRAAQILIVLSSIICSGCGQKADNRAISINDEIIAELTKVIAKEPANAAAYNKRGVMYYEQGNLEQAMADYNKAIEIDSKFAKAYVNRGLFYNKKEKFNQAIAEYSKAIEIEPDFSAAYNNRAVVYFFQKDYAKSWEDVAQAERLGYGVHPDFLEALKKASGRQK